MINASPNSSDISICSSTYNGRIVPLPRKLHATIENFYERCSFCENAV